jgi:hypothetical protein
MRFTFIAILLAACLSGCGGDDDADTGALDTSTSMPGTTAPADSSSGGGSTTGASLECDANVEFAFADGVDLGATSVDAVRLEMGGDTEYTVSVFGDAAGTMQLDIVFPGTPTAGMQYNATGLMQFGQPRVELLPDLAGELDFQSGTVTYGVVGTMQGDTLALELDLEFMRGPIAGCIQTDLTVQAG